MNRLTERIDDAAWSFYSYALRPLAWGFFVFGAVIMAIMAYEKLALWLM